MSRIASQPVNLPTGVTLTQDGRQIIVKGPKGQLQHQLHELVDLTQEDNVIRIKAGHKSKDAIAQSGTARSIIASMVKGVNDGFEKRLTLVGVGYRAKVQGSNIELTVGYSHPVKHPIPEHLTVECASQTEVVVKGINKQAVGQLAAEIRAYRPPEPYKGKGIRYNDERITLKEAKKK